MKKIVLVTIILLSVSSLFVLFGDKKINSDEKNIVFSGNDTIFRKDNHETIIKNRYIEVDNLKTHYVEVGEGDTIVLLPGWPGSWRVYIELIGELSKNYHVVAPDLPGFAGDTQSSNLTHNYDFYVEFVHDFLEEIDEEKVNMLGISAGGGITLLYGKEYPEDLYKIIVESPPYNRTEFKSRERFLFHLLERSNKKDCVGKFLTKILKYYFLKIETKRIIKKNNLDVLGDEFREFVIQDIEKIDEYAMIEVAIDITNHDLSDKLRNITIPVLVITGDKDDAIPFEISRKLVEDILPNGTFVLMEDEGHWVPVTNPKDFATKMDDFLKNN